VLGEQNSIVHRWIIHFDLDSKTTYKYSSTSGNSSETVNGFTAEVYRKKACNACTAITDNSVSMSL